MATGSSGIVKFDLETLEPVLNTPNIDASDVVDEIPFLYSPSSSNTNDSDTDLSQNNYYELSTDSEDEDLPTYSIKNFKMTVVEGSETNPLLIDIDDVINDWTNEIVDSGPSYGPFLSSPYTNIQNPHSKPEVFFESLFDERMWTIIAEATNVYARSKRVTQHGDHCTDPAPPSTKNIAT